MKDFHTPGFTLPSGSTFFRHLLPGIRKFVRGALVTKGILVILAGILLDRLSRRIVRRSIRVSLIIVVSVLILIDLNPLSYRMVHRDVTTIDPIIDILRSNPGPILNLVPAIEEDYLPVPISRLGVAKYGVHSFEGAEELSSYLADFGVRYVLLPSEFADRGVWPIIVQDSIRAQVPLEQPYFKRVVGNVRFEKTSLSGDETYSVTLYEVLSQTSKHRQGPSTLGQVIFEPQLVVERFDQARNTVLVDWATSRSYVIQFSKLSEQTEPHLPNFFRFTFRIEFPRDRSGNYGAVSVSINKRNVQTIDLYPSRLVEIVAPEGARIELGYDGPCPPPFSTESDIYGQSTCFGIGPFLIEEIVR